MAFLGRSRRTVEIKIDPAQVKNVTDDAARDILAELDTASQRLARIVGRGEKVNRELGQNIAKAEALNRKKS